MVTKIKGIYKGFKFIAQIFVAKEREMEIGYPTDVKHVAHIGWDGPSGTAPSWMNQFKTAPDFPTSIGNLGDQRSPDPRSIPAWPTRDFEDSRGSESTSNTFEDIPSSELPHATKKPKRKKTKSASSSSARAAKSKATFDGEATTIVQM